MCGDRPKHIHSNSSGYYYSVACSMFDLFLKNLFKAIRLFGEMKHYSQAIVECLKGKCEGQDLIARLEYINFYSQSLVI